VVSEVPSKAREHRPDVEWTAVLGGSNLSALVQETSMTLIWLGVLLVFGGVLQMAFQQSGEAD
jgi:hypothetical protein